MSVSAPFPVAFNGAFDRFVVTMGNQIIVTTKTGGVFRHDVNGNTVGPAIAFSGAKVAFNGPVDRFVVTMGNRIIVTTQSGGVFGHDVLLFLGSPISVGSAFALGGSKVAFNGAFDRFVVTMGNRIIVITENGGVFGHDVTGNTVGPAFAFGGSKVAFNRAFDRFVVTMGNRIIVITENGGVFGHDVTGNTVGPAFAFGGSKVAFNRAFDRFVVTMGNRIIVTTQDGGVWAHDINGTTVGPAFPMNFVLSHFTFASDISAGNRQRTLDRHRFALMRSTGCNNLSAEEKSKLHGAYDRAIHHTTNTDPNANASAAVGGSSLSVNFGVLFPQGDEEISQTLIHEMMHSAGYTHPTRRDPPSGSSCARPDPDVFDCPGDNGVYYGTAPLRAEMCIAGDQSDVRSRLTDRATTENCVIDDNGVATIHKEASRQPLRA
ncbi:hypothetical protein [Streptomyces erythrochromogenes]|uniref:hypothetical protein n=1 Tax=Streptomyces erythrochromogenes TaxID=285574 RepID=UPI003863E410|nr:hypothetical protein OG364_00560 [Streptomyces erythrochromogenes]WST98430.1 hypothetical protein OG364_40975 [Streptomyces erythrochromogenes]